MRPTSSRRAEAVLVLVCLAACGRKVPPPRTPEPPIAAASPRELFERYAAGDARTRWRLLDARTRERIAQETQAWQARLEKDPAESARVRERLKLGQEPWKMETEALLLARLDAERRELKLLEARDDLLVVEEGGERREWRCVREEGQWRLRLP